VIAFTHQRIELTSLINKKIENVSMNSLIPNNIKKLASETPYTTLLGYNV
jgi:hypothetical protein